MMNYKNKICDFFSSNLNKIGILILFYIFLIALFNKGQVFNPYAEAYDFNPCILLLSTIIMIGVIVRYSAFLDRAKQKHIIYIMAFAATLLVLLQIVYVYNFTYHNYTDLSSVHDAAIELMKKGRMDKISYFSQYTNNIPITLFLAGIYKLANMIGITDYKNIGIAVNMISMDLCILSLGLLVNQKYGIRKAAVILGLILINPIFYLYLPTYYTNSMTLVFYPALLFLYNCFYKNKKISYLILLGFLSILGFKLRATVFIMLIAILFNMVINFKIKDFIKYAAIIIVSVIISNGVYGIIENKYIKFDYSETRYPITHWMMMGSRYSSHNGGYNREDDTFTGSFDTYDEKLKETTAEFIKRVKECGIRNNIVRMHSKYINLFANGSYGALQQGQNVEKFKYMYPYILGERSIFFNYYIQMMHLTLLFLAIVFCIKNYNNYTFGINKTWILFIFGTFIFYSFWESNSRYSLMMLPALLFLSMNGAEVISDKIVLKENLDKILIIKSDGDKEIKRENILKNIRKFKNVLLLVIVFVIAFNYGKHTKDKITAYDFSVNNYRSNATEAINNQDILNQTFITDKDFNRIEIYGNNVDANKDENIEIKITDNSNNNKVYSQTIPLRNFNDDGVLKLKLNEIKPNISTEYAISINAVNVKNMLTINKFYKGNSNQVSGGSISINGEEKPGNIQFKVYKEYKSAFMTSKRYVLFSMIIIFISVVSLYGQSIFKNVKHKIKKYIFKLTIDNKFRN